MTVTANNNTDGNKSAGSRRRSVLVFIPLVVFLALAVVFFIRLGAGDISRIPSVLIGHPAPATVLPGVAGPTEASFLNRLLLGAGWAYARLRASSPRTP